MFNISKTILYLKFIKLLVFSIHTSSIERSYLLEEKEDEDCDMDIYHPVQPLSNDHGVSFFPISAPHNNINHHILQVI